MEYPKLLTLFNRETSIPFRCYNEVRLPEVQYVSNWEVTEKIDGTNICIRYNVIRGDNGEIRAGQVEIRNRKKDAGSIEIPEELLDWIGSRAKAAIFEPLLRKQNTSITLFGEGYGPGIRKGGSYTDEKRFCLFDVLIDDRWWMNSTTVTDFAEKFGFDRAPIISFDPFPGDFERVVHMARTGFDSPLAAKFGKVRRAEGLIAVAPGLFNWKGERVMFKLKTAEDFNQDGSFAVRREECKTSGS